MRNRSNNVLRRGEALLEQGQDNARIAGEVSGAVIPPAAGTHRGDLAAWRPDAVEIPVLSGLKTGSRSERAGRMSSVLSAPDLSVLGNGSEVGRHDCNRLTCFWLRAGPGQACAPMVCRH